MTSRWLRSAVGLVCAGMLLAGCGGAGEEDVADASAGTPPSRQDTDALVEQALAARAANDPAQFAALLSAASRACPDAGAARRLGEVAATAARWSSSVLEGRPKAQAVTEAQLAKLDWDAIAAPCVAP